MEGTDWLSELDYEKFKNDKLKKKDFKQKVSFDDSVKNKYNNNDKKLYNSNNNDNLLSKSEINVISSACDSDQNACDFGKPSICGWYMADYIIIFIIFMFNKFLFLFSFYNLVIIVWLTFLYSLFLLIYSVKFIILFSLYITLLFIF